MDQCEGPEALKFLAPDEVARIAGTYGTPVFVYDLKSLKRYTRYFQAIPNAYGLDVRYSVKANPNKTILQIFDRLGTKFDVSSIWEAARVVGAGIDPRKVLFTGQEASDGWMELCEAGMEFDAGSLRQLEEFGTAFPGRDVSVRFNPGFGSGLVKKLTSGGSHSSFGIWHEQLEEVLKRADQHRLRIRRLHFHIGSGHETSVLERTVDKALELCRRIPSIEVLDFGGGYRVSALSTDPIYDHHAVGMRIAQRLERFAGETGRRLRLELEPGTYLTALAGSIVAKVIDIVHTGRDGYRFIKIDAGLTEIIRPSYYGALHPLVSVARDGSIRAGSDTYMVCGHCCIAGDNLTPVPANSEDFAPRLLSPTYIGDFLVVERAGGYAASMCIKNFNSYPEASELCRLAPHEYVVIRKRQTLDQITANEVTVDGQRIAEALSTTPHPDLASLAASPLTA